MKLSDKLTVDKRNDQCKDINQFYQFPFFAFSRKINEKQQRCVSQFSFFSFFGIWCYFVFIICATDLQQTRSWEKHESFLAKCPLVVIKFSKKSYYSLFWGAVLKQFSNFGEKKYWATLFNVVVFLTPLPKRYILLRFLNTWFVVLMNKLRTKMYLRLHIKIIPFSFVRKKKREKYYENTFSINFINITLFLGNLKISFTFRIGICFWICVYDFKCLYILFLFWVLFVKDLLDTSSQHNWKGCS